MKHKLTHPALEYVTGHDSEIIVEPTRNKYENKFSIIVSGSIQVCPTCGGTGSHDRRDLDCSRLVDDMQADGDYEGIQDYFNGAYSQTCEECHGKNVVLVPNWDLVPDWAIKAIEDWDQSERESRAEQAAERAMGA